MNSTRPQHVEGTVRDGARGKRHWRSAGRSLLAASGALTAAVCLTACGGSAGQPTSPSAGSGVPSVAVSTTPLSNKAGAATPTPSATTAGPLSAPSGPSATPQQTVVSAVIDNCSGKQVPQPSEVVLTCADAGWVLDHLKWTHWGLPTASASGEWSEKNCKPNCATGGISTYPVTVTVSRLSGTAYTRMSISAPTSPTPQAAFVLGSAGPAFVTAK